MMNSRLMLYKFLNSSFSLVIVLLIFGCGPSEEELKKKELETKYKCNGIDDCLSKYEFEGARAFYGISLKNSYDLEQIVTAESHYSLEQGDYKRALSIVNESDIDEVEKSRLRYQLISIVVDEFIEKRDWEKAKELSLKVSSTEGEDGIEKYSDESSQQDILLNKVQKAEMLFKQN